MRRSGPTASAWSSALLSLKLERHGDRATASVACQPDALGVDAGLQSAARSVLVEEGVRLSVSVDMAATH